MAYIYTITLCSSTGDCVEVLSQSKAQELNNGKKYSGQSVGLEDELLSVGIIFFPGVMIFYAWAEMECTR